MRVRDAGRLSDNTAPCPQAIRQRYPGLRIVILTRLENAGVVHMLLSQGVQCIVSRWMNSAISPAISRAATALSVAAHRDVGAGGGLRPGGPVGADPARDGSDPAFPGRADGQRDRAAPGSQQEDHQHAEGYRHALGVQSDIELLRYGIDGPGRRLIGLASPVALRIRHARMSSLVKARTRLISTDFACGDWGVFNPPSSSWRVFGMTVPSATRRAVRLRASREVDDCSRDETPLKPLVAALLGIAACCRSRPGPRPMGRSW